MNRMSSSLSLSVLILTAMPAFAQKLVDLSKLKDAMEDAVVKREMKNTPKLKGEANILNFKITGIRINGEKPELKAFWVTEELVPVFSCPNTPAKEYTQTRRFTSSSSVTFTETVGLKANVEVTVKGTAGAVEGTVAAGLEASIEKGISKTTGKEVVSETGQTWTVPSGTGMWVGGAGMMYDYVNAPYEVDFEVTKAMFRSPVNMMGWLPKEYGGKDALKLTAKGTMSARILEGGIEVNSVEMSADELKSFCGSTAGRPTNRIVKGLDPITVPRTKR